MLKLSHLNAKARTFSAGTQQPLGNLLFVVCIGFQTSIRSSQHATLHHRYQDAKRRCPDESKREMSLLLRPKHVVCYHHNGRLSNMRGAINAYFLMLGSFECVTKQRKYARLRRGCVDAHQWRSPCHVHCRTDSDHSHIHNCSSSVQ